MFGNRVLRVEDKEFLTSGGRYVDDVPLDGACWVSYVRSPIAHARIGAVETARARAAIDVIDVVLAADLDGLGPIPPRFGSMPAAMGRPLIAGPTVRFVGEPVAAVVASTPAAAADAAEMVEVDYEPLRPLPSPWEALRGEVLLFPDLGTNVAHAIGGGDDGSLFEGCEVVVSQEIVNQRVAPCPLEVRAAASAWSDDGRLVHWSSTQAPFHVRSSLASLLGLSEEAVRVIAPDVGGGFGAKMGDYPEELLVAWLARRLGRPVRWCETRSESMVGLGHGRGQHQRVTIGGSRDGKVLAYRLEVLQDAGAYPMIGAVLPGLTRVMLTGTYDIPRAAFASRSVVTSTTPVVAYRGAGRPEAAAAIERAMDRFAAEIGLDPAEVRRRNLIKASQFPFTTAAGTVYDSGDYHAALEKLLVLAGYEELRLEQAERRARHDPVQLGIGLATYVEITGGAAGAGEYGAVEVNEDGSVVVRTGTSAHGQGHGTAWRMLVSEQLGLPLDRIEFVQSDTDRVKRGIGTFGSRSLQTGGIAARRAAVEVVELARQLAADVLEADPLDLVVDATGNGIHVAGSPSAALSWGDLARAGSERGRQLRAEVDFDPPSATFPFGAHLALVEVDTETGGVRLRRLVAVDDAGPILNPVLADGQIHGGLAQGAAQALLEEFRYDADANPLSANLADYSFISATELPRFELGRTETPTPHNELGVKGIGESGTIGSTPAVQNAVVDALAPYGVNHLDMPAAPERIWRCLSDIGAVAAVTPQHPPMGRRAPEAWFGSAPEPTAPDEEEGQVF